MSTPMRGGGITGGGLGSASQGGGFGAFTPRTSTKYTPPAAPGATGPAPLAPGTINVNPLDPVGSGASGVQETGNVLDGLKKALFGTNAPSQVTGQHGGPLGDIPIASDLLRFGSEAIANTLSIIPKTPGWIADTVGGTLEHISSPIGQDEVRQKYAALPADAPEKIAAEKELAAGQGSLIPVADLHIMSKALRAYAAGVTPDKADLFAGLNSPSGSLADTINNILGMSMTAPQRISERIVAGMDSGSSGNNELDKVMSVGSGQTAFTAGTPGLTPVEQHAYEKVAAGRAGTAGGWTDAEGLDYLASHGAGYSHDPLVEMGGQVFLDPLFFLSFGAGYIAKAGRTGAALFVGLSDSERMLELAKGGEAVTAAGRIGRTGVATAAELTRQEGILASMQRLGMPVEQIARQEKAISIAKYGGGPEDIKAAEEMVKMAKARTVRELGSAKKMRSANVLARTVGQSEGAADVMRAFGKVYTGLQGTSIGRAAKITRTIIDPLHALDLHSVLGARNVDLLSSIVPKTVIGSLGDLPHLKVVNRMEKLLPGGALRNWFDEAVGLYSTKVARDVVGNARRDEVLMQGEKEAVALRGTRPSEVVDSIMNTPQKRGILGSIAEQANRFRIQSFDTPALEDLSRRMEKMAPGGMSREAWMEEFKTMKPDELSFLHAATWAKANDMVLAAATSITSTGTGGLSDELLHRLTLIDRTTPTQFGVEGILSRIGQAADNEKAAMAEIRAAQDLYSRFRGFVIDPTDPRGTIEKFVQYLEHEKPHLPMQATHEEIAALNQKGQDLVSALGGIKPKGATAGPGAEINGAWNLGFQPEDQYLWNLERTNASEGLLAKTGDVWLNVMADVGTTGAGYRAGHVVPVNIAGLPIIGAKIEKGAHAFDYIEAMGRMLTHQVTGGMVADAAHGKFLALASSKFETVGITKGVAEDIWKRLGEVVDLPGSNLTSARGMSKGDIWKHVQDLIPMESRGKLDPYEMMGLVLDAYNGDTRFIGLTQKFTASAKAVLGKTTHANYAGEIAEHLWPTLKFHYNPIFQLQEKIEPWVLNTQRGIAPWFGVGTEKSAADIRTEFLLQKMMDHSLTRMGDVTAGEYQAAMMAGSATTAAAKVTDGKVGKLFENLMNVQGVKRVAMLRTFRAGLGKLLKADYDAVEPGLWDAMFKDAQSQVRYLLDQDEFAVNVMSDKLLGSDVLVKRLEGVAGQFGGWHADIAPALLPGQWALPSDIGALQRLDLDGMAKLAQFPNGHGSFAKDANEVRRGLAQGTIKWEDIAQYLRGHRADQDYINRVDNAYHFSYKDFWQNADAAFNLTKEESAALQDMIGQTAALRGVTPVEYMSQIWSPIILKGGEASVGDLGKAVDLLRSYKTPAEKGLAQFAGRVDETGKALSTRDEFITQLSAVFSAHLDPSSKHALLMEMRPELEAAVAQGKVQLDIKDVHEMFDQPETQSWLADKLLGYMSGKMPSGAHTVITDPAIGSATLRGVATSILTDQARNAMPVGRRLMHEDPALGEEMAKGYQDLTEVAYARNNQTINKTQLFDPLINGKVKQIVGTPDRTVNAYEQLATEVNTQFGKMTTGPKKLTIIVSKNERPYADGAALQKDLAKHEMRVFGGNTDHPYLYAEQVVRLRAVHQALGYGAEGFDFTAQGAMNAAASHAVLFKDEARSAFMTEVLGKASWEHYSPEVVPDITKPITTTAEYAALHPDEGLGAGPSGQGHWFSIDWVDPTTGQGWVLPVDAPLITHSVDPAVTQLEPFQQALLVSTFHEFRSMLPNLRLAGFNVVDFEKDFLMTPGVRGLTLHTGAEEGGRATDIVIFIDSKSVVPDAERSAAYWATKDADNEASRLNPILYKNRPRQSLLGTPALVGSSTLRQDVIHELGHALDANLEMRAGTALAKEHAAFKKTYLVSDGRKIISEYGMSQGDSEAYAELVGLAINPDNQPWLTELRGAMERGELTLEWDAAAGSLLDSVAELRAQLERAGEYVPVPAASPFAGQTVRDVNAAARGAMRQHAIAAPTKAGLLPQELIDRFASTFIGSGKYLESNPDIARTAQMFGKWSTAQVKEGLFKSGWQSTAIEDVMNEIKLMPTDAAVPYNETQAQLMHLMTQSMQDKWKDAYRLQYFAQSRTMLERSINHPMFGIYPASYMWGKLGPEMVRFIAKEPFGIRTGAMAMSLLDVQKAIAMRREYDPAFEAQIQKLGHSQAMSWLGYLLPALPWDLSSSYPLWARDLAGQGIANELRVTQGKNQNELDISKPALDVVNKFAPLTTTIPWASRAAKEIVSPAQKALQGVIGQPAQPSVSQPGAPAPATTGPTQGTNLAPVLEQSLTELRGILQ